MAESDFNNVKSVVQSILTSSSSSMTIAQLLTDYALKEGHKLPHKELGFSSVYALLKSMDGILELPPYPNEHSTIKVIVDTESLHSINLIRKQNLSKIRNVTGKRCVPAHQLNDYDSNMKYTTDSNTLENNCNAYGYNVFKNHSNNSPKPRGYVTKELKIFIETMCSNDLISVLELKYELINHPHYCKLNTTNIDESVNMLKSFINIKNNCVHLKDSENNILYQEKRLKIYTRPSMRTNQRYMSKGTNHQHLNYTFLSKALNEYYNTLNICNGPDMSLEKCKSINEIKMTFSSSLMESYKSEYTNMIVSIIAKSKTPISAVEVFTIFKIKHLYNFPLSLFGCMSVLDFFHLTPALFKLENRFSSKSIVTLIKQEPEKPRCAKRKFFMIASKIDDLLKQNTEQKPVTLSVLPKEFILSSDAAKNLCKEDNGDAQISDANTQTSCSVISTSISDYEIYDSDMVLDSMKKKMRCVLSKYENGILCNAFMDIYANEYSGFTFSEYGFRSMSDMAFNLPSVFYVKETEDGDEYVLYNACRRSELHNEKIDPALYYKNIPKTVLYNLSIIFDKYRTGISYAKLKHLYQTEFGLCYEPLKYGFSSDKHMFKSLNKMVEIKDNDLYTLNPFVYTGFANENLLTKIVVQKKQTCTDLGNNQLDGNSVCNKNFRYTPFQLTNDKIFMVFIAEIFQPSSFYIHLETKQETLNNLMADLQTFYDKHETKYKVSPNLLFPELACCLQFEDTTMWHRAIILDIVDEIYVKVLYVDYGTLEVVQKTRIRLLALEFGTEPILAQHCCMFEQDKFVYTRKMNEMFVEIVRDLKLEAHIGGYRKRKDGVQQMILSLFLNTGKARLCLNNICFQELKRISMNNNKSTLTEKEEE